MNHGFCFKLPSPVTNASVANDAVAIGLMARDFAKRRGDGPVFISEDGGRAGINKRGCTARYWDILFGAANHWSVTNLYKIGDGGGGIPTHVLPLQRRKL